jgi:hypothetical protein
VARLRSRLALGALAAAQVAYGRGSRPPAATRAVVGLMLGTSALDARASGDGRAMAAAGAVGFGAELVGVATGRPFGRYAYSDRLGPRICGVPLLAAGAWTLMARPAWVVAGLLAPSRRAAPTARLAPSARLARRLAPFARLAPSGRLAPFARLARPARIALAAATSAANGG